MNMSPGAKSAVALVAGRVSVMVPAPEAITAAVALAVWACGAQPEAIVALTLAPTGNANGAPPDQVQPVKVMVVRPVQVAVRIVGVTPPVETVSGGALK